MGKTGNVAWCKAECNGLKGAACHTKCSQKCKPGCSCVDKRTMACGGVKNNDSGDWCIKYCNGKNCDKKCATSCNTGCSCVDWDASTVTKQTQQSEVVIVTIGPSKYNQWCVDQKSPPVKCDVGAANKGVRLNTDYQDAADTFSISTPGNVKVCARRTDAQTFGWGMKLQIRCKKLVGVPPSVIPPLTPVPTTAAPTKAPTPTPKNEPPAVTKKK